MAHAAHLGDLNELRPSFLECWVMALVCHTFSHFAALLLWPGGTDSALETGCYSLPETETICQQDEFEVWWLEDMISWAATKVGW